MRILKRRYSRVRFSALGLAHLTLCAALGAHLSIKPDIISSLFSARLAWHFFVRARRAYAAPLYFSGWLDPLHIFLIIVIAFLFAGDVCACVGRFRTRCKYLFTCLTLRTFDLSLYQSSLSFICAPPSFSIRTCALVKLVLFRVLYTHSHNAVLFFFCVPLTLFYGNDAH